MAGLGPLDAAPHRERGGGAETPSRRRPHPGESRITAGPRLWISIAGSPSDAQSHDEGTGVAMNRSRTTARTTWRQRAALRRIGRELRAQDPDLAALLSGSRPAVLPPLRFRSVPARGYALAGILLIVVGIFLGVGSAVLWGTVALLLAAVRTRLEPELREGTSRHPEPGHRDPHGA